MNDVKLALDRLLDVLAGHGLSDEHSIIALAVICFGAGAALLHPIIAIVSTTWAGVSHVVAMPGMAIRRRRYQKYMEARDKRETKKSLESLHSDMDRCVRALDDAKKNSASIGNLHARINELHIRLNEHEVSTNRRFETVDGAIDECDTQLRAVIDSQDAKCDQKCYSHAPCATCPKLDLKFDDDDSTDETLQIIQLDDDLIKY